jgi:hypothetical protein
MAITYSDQVMRAMGFHPFSDSEIVSAKFFSVHVYQMQGITVPADYLKSYPVKIADHQHPIAIGNSVNSLSRLLFNDDFTQDEEAWKRENNCAPPYLAIKYGPTCEHSVSNGWIKADDDGISTFDSFRAAKAELEQLEEITLPSLTSALHSSFSAPNQYFQLKEINRVVVGITVKNDIVKDTRFEFNHAGFLVTQLSVENLQHNLQKTQSVISRINPKVARFIHLARQEEDPLKRFLYFFLAIEIETHSVYASIDHSKNLAKLINVQPHIQVASTSLFESQREKLTSLKDRFIWCVMCVWTHMQDSDVESFKRLKKIRDDIAHGSISAPPGDSVVSVEKLAIKLQALHML